MTYEPRSQKYTSLVVFLVFLILLSCSSYFRWLEPLELISFDYRFRLRPNQTTEEKIVIIEIAEDTLTQLKHWPLPRDFHASLIDVLSEFGAKQIIFDVFFSEPTSEDALLNASIIDAANVYLPSAVDFSPKEIKPYVIPPAKGLKAPLLEKFRKSVKGHGHVNVITDLDGKRRRVPLLFDLKGEMIPHLSLRVACDYLNISLENIKLEPNTIIVDDRLRIPTDKGSLMFVNFAGPWKETYRHYSYVDILFSYQQIEQGRTPKINLEELRDAICFVGVTATGSVEIAPVPIEKDYRMIGILVNSFNSMIHQRFIVRLAQWINLLVLFVLIGLVSILALRLTPLYSLLSMLSLGIIYLVLAVGAFVFYDVWVDMVTPLVGALVLYFSIVLKEFFMEWQARKLLDKELSVARDIQKSFLPLETNTFGDLKMNAIMDAARYVGGDFYDVVELAHNKSALLIGDVSGKGVPAALIMGRVLSIFRSIIKTTDNCAELLIKLNEQLLENKKGSFFVTLIACIYDRESKELIFSNAGHLPIGLARGDEVKFVSSHAGMPIGIVKSAEFVQESIILKEGDTLVFYTDGVTEANNSKKDEFQERRLRELIKQYSYLSSYELSVRIRNTVEEFAKGLPQKDDITIIVIKKD